MIAVERPEGVLRPKATVSPVKKEPEGVLKRPAAAEEVIKRPPAAKESKKDEKKNGPSAKEAKNIAAMPIGSGPKKAATAKAVKYTKPKNAQKDAATPERSGLRKRPSYASLSSTPKQGRKKFGASQSVDNDGRPSGTDNPQSEGDSTQVHGHTKTQACGLMKARKFNVLWRSRGLPENIKSADEEAEEDRNKTCSLSSLRHHVLNLCVASQLL